VPDPLAAARARGLSARDRLTESAGGLLRLEDVADRLETTLQAVDALRLQGAILAVPLPNGEWAYPGCQFAEDGLVPGIDTFLCAFPDADPWTRLAVLLSPSGRNSGASALDLLKQGDEAAARSIAVTYGTQG
jgi:hypothetical protein